MKLIDIHTREHGRHAQDINKIHLYKDSGTSPWWHAYEWSAWLCEFYPSGLSEAQRLRPVRRNMKEDEHGIVNVGMQIESAKKYMPGATCEMDEDGMHCTLTVDITKYNVDKAPADILVEWKDSVPVKKKEDNAKHTNVYARPSSFSAIMRKIIGYQLEDRTHEDHVLFIRELKNMCSDLI